MITEMSQGRLSKISSVVLFPLLPCSLSTHHAVAAVLDIGSAVNLHLEQTAPWTALKKGSDEEKEAAAKVSSTTLALYVPCPPVVNPAFVA